MRVTASYSCEIKRTCRHNIIVSLFIAVFGYTSKRTATYVVVYFNQCLGAAQSIVRTIQSSFPPSSNFDRITLSFDKFNTADLFL